MVIQLERVSTQPLGNSTPTTLKCFTTERGWLYNEIVLKPNSGPNSITTIHGQYDIHML